MTAGSTSRNQELDRLRAFAILVTVLAHLPRVLPQIKIPWWSAHAGAGVDLFFVISGYIISAKLVPRIDAGLTAKAGATRIKSVFKTVGVFYLRRYFRLLPLCYFWLGIIAAVCAGFYLEGTSVPNLLPANIGREILAIVLFGHSYFTVESDSFSLFWHWSLAVEEQYYFAYPLLLLAIDDDAKRIKSLFFGIVFITFVLRPLLGAFAFPGFHYRHLSFLRFDCVMSGCLIYLTRNLGWQSKLREWRRQNLGWIRPWAIGLGLIFSMVFVTSLFGNNAGVSVQYPFTLGVSTLLVALASAECEFIFPGPLFRRSLSWLGTRSYALYLAHVPLLFLCEKINPGSDIKVLVGYVLLLGITGELSFQLVENPSIRLGRNIARTWNRPRAESARA